MKRTWFLLPIAAACGLVGCSLSYNENWGNGELGDECEESSDCAQGLQCVVDICVHCNGACDDDDDGAGGDEGPAPPEGCTENAQCPQGSFCLESDGICVDTGACDCDAECGEGLTCDEDLGSCVPGEDPAPPPPSCEELGTELECLERVDCVPVYTGINCSCGPDCVCSGVEPNCVCERFDFFACAVAG